MRTFVGKDQAYLIVDTTKRNDSVMVILRATDATPIFWSQERADLESNIDAGGNPQAGMQLLNTDPPLVLIGAKIVVWARATANTKIECQVVVQKLTVGTAAGPSGNSPGAAPPSRPIRHDSTVQLPGPEESWNRKGGFQ